MDMNISDEIEPDPSKRPAGPSRVEPRIPEKKKKGSDNSEDWKCTLSGCPSDGNTFKNATTFRKHLT